MPENSGLADGMFLRPMMPAGSIVRALYHKL